MALVKEIRCHVEVSHVARKPHRRLWTLVHISGTSHFSSFFAGCRKSDQPLHRTFASPEAAGSALLAAAKSGDQNALLGNFWPGFESIFLSPATLCRTKTPRSICGRILSHAPLAQDAGWFPVLLVGADNFPFPIPLKKNDSGQWFFDTAAGKEEILRRRIGRNELSVIEICEALADAQATYYSQHHDDGKTKQYALKFISDPGKQNGLYWDSPEGRPKSPLGPMVAYATGEGYSQSRIRTRRFMVTTSVC